MKSLIFSSIFAIAITSFGASADAVQPNCPVLREAQATIIVFKASFTQQNGVWVPSTTEVGRSQTQVPVVGGLNSGCVIPASGLFRLDNISVNGQPETVNVHAWVRVSDTEAYINKRFAASYWLSSGNGRNGWASADSSDLKLEKIGVSMNLESAAATSSAHDDIVTIQVRFDDNAQ
jgi:hypothetical protein